MPDARGTPAAQCSHSGLVSLSGGCCASYPDGATASDSGPGACSDGTFGGGGGGAEVSSVLGHALSAGNYSQDHD